ncbi:hypothetical protein O7632_30340 [Solwaraspora sp. WMMD406]|nr:hypothetical protein [Solwaraspora sp. WMMD406]MDG4768359.1 hypothetical protein [Solwaraspora sp. WMMD406]
MNAHEIDANAAELLVKAALDPDVESDFDPEIDAMLASAVDTANRL